MQLSKKSEYAVRAVVLLAAQGVDRSMGSGDIATRGDIPHKFLEQILLVLRRSHLVTSKRGVGGGYRIAREPRLISVAEVVISVEGQLSALPGGEGESRNHEFPGATGVEDCFTRAMDAYNTILEETTVEDLLNHESGDSMVGFGI